ncbi:MAG: alpha-1,2-fucosyltransferase [Candidatus Cloacimonetes bacterium]|jgi:hypothetical protein|nr:alpha-1,2-fucosyltransferase [Candidatus Cloacimonadota bacterium]
MSRPIVGVIFSGGFGNQLFQYAFARAYAELYHATLLTPGWIGQRIFSISDQPLDYDLPRSGFDEIPNGRVNIVLNGYFQFQDAINFLSRAKLKTWFRFKNEWRVRFNTHLHIAAHLRRGDYMNLSNIYCLVSEDSYITACKKFGLDHNNIYWVKEGSRKQPPDLLNLGIPFLEDFMMLVNANNILRANSSFSWWANVLSDGKTFSPVVENRLWMQDVDFVEGNWPRLVDKTNCGENITDLHLKD